jgi:hypothetical protein
MEHLSSDMEQQDQEQQQGQQVEWRRESARALQQRIQSKRDISTVTSWTGYSK